eukprot:507461-Rhodomonas_salina.1
MAWCTEKRGSSRVDTTRTLERTTSSSAPVASGVLTSASPTWVACDCSPSKPLTGVASGRRLKRSTGDPTMCRVQPESTHM